MSGENVSPENAYKSTPPTNRKVKNPFDKVLIERLHKPLCSPGMCKIYKKQCNGLFVWEIDQACNLVPADIVPCNSQFDPSPDPALEKIAEEATERFFSQEMVMPSPLVSSKKNKPLQVSHDTSEKMSSLQEESIITGDVSSQTVLTLPPELPPELETILKKYCTFTQDQNLSGDYEITANGSLRRKLFFEEHSYMEQEHYDSEQTDDEIHVEQIPHTSYEHHAPVAVSPDLSRDLVAKGMKRTFGTPLKSAGPSYSSKHGFRNKILDVVDIGEPCFSPIQSQTPRRAFELKRPSSLASDSISPVDKVTSSDEEKNNFTSPESEAMATCLDCIDSDPEVKKTGPCFCKATPDKSVLKRSKSLKDSPIRNRKGSFSERRSSSMSSLHRSRSVQKLDFSMDMSVDSSSFLNNSQDSESIPQQSESQPAWSITEESRIFTTNAHTISVEVQSSTKLHSETQLIDDTPIKGKSRSNVLSHEISKIRASNVSPLYMSLDGSMDGTDDPLGLEYKKVYFSTVDLKFLTENVTKFDYNATKTTDDVSTSFKRVDSGFNENTFYANASSYYESAIKPSELTVTNVSKTALKETSNVNWMRVDSGFRDENSTESEQFFVDKTKGPAYVGSETKDKENDFDRFLMQTTSRSETMSDIFTEEMTFNCNFSSTPSKSKARNINS